jgi:uncharacterized protein YPO0396
MSNNLGSFFTSMKALDKKSVEFLSKALEKNNLPGFDYIEFRQSVLALLQMNMDQATAIRSAFVTARTMGLSKEKLVETAAYYKQVLAKEKGQFDAALQNQLQQRVVSKEEDVKKWKVQIERLRQQIEDLQRGIDASGGEIETARNKIRDTQVSFEETFRAIMGEIDKDIDSFKNYLD